MKSLVHPIAVTMALAGFLTVPAAAQLDGLPVFFSPKGGTGLTIYGDFGRGLNEASGKTNAVGARASLGISVLTVSLGTGVVNPEVGGDREVRVQYMGSVALRFIGGGLIPIAVSGQVGVGHLSLSDDASERNVAIGLGVALNLPTPGFTFEPWVAPRVSIRRVETGGDLQTQTGFGLSAGVNLGFTMGLGIHAAVDWTHLSEQSSGGLVTLLETKPAIIGVGIHYSFRLPLGL